MLRRRAESPLLYKTFDVITYSRLTFVEAKQRGRQEAFNVITMIEVSKGLGTITELLYDRRIALKSNNWLLTHNDLLCMQ